jgi:AraC-like DNA-binding protein
MSRTEKNLYRPHLFGTLEHSLRWAYEGPPSYRGRGATDSPEPSIWHVIRGSVSVRVGREEVRAGAGDFVVPSSLPRFQEFSEDARLFSCGLRLQWPDGHQLVRMNHSLRFPVSEERALLRAMNALKVFSKRHLGGLWNNYPRLRIPLGVHAQAEALFWQLLHHYIAALEKRGVTLFVPEWEDDRLSKALHRIESHPGALKFDSRQLAREVGLSTSQLNRLFRQTLGTSPHRQYDLMRFQKAMKLIEGKQHSIKEIAIETGFSNLSHFSKWFRSHARISPLEYRKHL